MASTREIIVKALIRETVKKMANDLRGSRVFFFGSRVGGGARTRSDFDVGILGKKQLSASLFYKLEDELEELPTLFKIDLVDLARVSERFKQEALRNTETIYV
jgi:predicted nucleotidyltransferase